MQKTFPSAALLMSVVMAGLLPNTRAAAESILISTNLGWTPYEQIADLVPAFEAYGTFGANVAISDDWELVRSRLAGDPKLDYGSVEWFRGGSSNWQPAAQLALDASGSTSYPLNLCSPLAIDGDLMAIGNPWVSTGWTNHQGEVDVFRRHGNVWNLEAVLIDTNATVGYEEDFGCSVAISHDTVIIGAPYAVPTGGAFVATFESGAWRLSSRLPIADPTAAFIGTSVAILDDVLVVGAPGPDFGTTTIGRAYVFTKSADRWTQRATLAPPDSDGGDQFGAAVSVGTHSIVVGAPANHTDGSIYVYSASPSSGYALLDQLTETNRSGNVARFGFAIAQDDDRMIVAEPGRATARLFQWNGSGWSSRSRFAADATTNHDGFGTSVAIHGRSVMIGAIGEDDGHAYIFRDDQIFNNGFE